MKVRIFSGLLLLALLFSALDFSTNAGFICAVIAGEPKGPLAGFTAKRSWADQTGRFKIDAQLSFADESQVKLLKSDGKVVTVPLDKLSENDQTYVNGFLKAEAALSTLNSVAGDAAENPFAGGEPADASASMDGSSDGSGFGGAASDGGLPPQINGPIPTRETNLKGARPLSITPAKPFWSIPPIKAFPQVEFEESIVDLDIAKPFFASMRVMAAGRNGNVIFNSYRQGRGKEENYGRFAVMDASTGQASSMQEFDQAWKMMALTPDGSRMAAVRVEGFDKGNDLAVFRIANGYVVPEFQFAAGGGSWDELHFAAFLPGNRLATISQKHNLTIWDLSNAARIRATHRGSTGGALSAELSPASDLMVIVMGTSIAFIDTTSHKLVGAIPQDEKPSKLAISTDGKLLAVFKPFDVTLYSMETGEIIKSIAVAESNGSASFQWIGDHLKIGSVLYDIDRGMPIWTYAGRPSAEAALGNYLFTAFGGDDGSTVTTLKIPHDEAIRATGDINAENIYCIKPGDAVSVEFQVAGVPTQVQQSVRQAVEIKLADLGWKLSSSAPNKMIIKLEQGKQDQAEYYTRTGFGPIFAPPGFGGPRPSGPAEKVSFTPWTHAMTIQSNGAEVFKVNYVRSAPQNLTTKDGESTQTAVSRICQPSPDYFKNLAIPPHLLKPEFQGGLGKSEITKTGLR